MVQDSYDNEWLDGAKKNVQHMAGGYSMHEYYARTMFEAFSGLGVFIEDEIGGRRQPAASATTGTLGAVEVAGGRVKPKAKVMRHVDIDDVF